MSRGQFRDLVLTGDRRRSSFSGFGIFPDVDNTFFFQLGRLSQVSEDKIRFDDDAVDRLNYKYSSLLLLMSIGLLTIRQNVGKPIQCWIPQEFTQGWEEYTENYCWVSNTYFYSIDSKSSVKKFSQNEVKYYQWIPIILGIQSLLFSFPCFLWRYMSSRSGVDLQKTLKLLNDGVNSVENDQKAVTQLSKMLHNLILKKNIHSKLSTNRNHWYHLTSTNRKIKFFGWFVKCRKFFKCGTIKFPSRGNKVLCLSYLIMKVFNLGNVLFQIYLMKKVIGNDNWCFGAKTLFDLLCQRYWTESGNFPRITFCDFETKKLGKNLKYTIQCVLPMNMFVEKIYTFLWFWYLFMILLNTLSLFLWIRRLFCTPVRLIKNYLKFSNKNSYENSTVDHFIRHFLNMDMIFILYFIRINISDLTASQLTEQLWCIYFFQNEQKENEENKFSNYFGLGSRVPSLMINDQLFNPPQDNENTVDIL